MTVTKDEVAHTAKLSKLWMNDAELEIYTTQLNDVLNYMKILDSVDTDGVLETNQVTGLVNVMREDVAEDYPLEKRQKLLAGVPVMKQGYVVVPHSL